jgi:hypothetical protein
VQGRVCGDAWETVGARTGIGYGGLTKQVFCKDSDGSREIGVSSGGDGTIDSDITSLGERDVVIKKLLDIAV